MVQFSKLVLTGGGRGTFLAMVKYGVYNFIFIETIKFSWNMVALKQFKRTMFEWTVIVVSLWASQLNPPSQHSCREFLSSVDI